MRAKQTQDRQKLRSKLISPAFCLCIGSYLFAMTPVHAAGFSVSPFDYFRLLVEDQIRADMDSYRIASMFQKAGMETTQSNRTANYQMPSNNVGWNGNRQGETGGTGYDQKFSNPDKSAGWSGLTIDGYRFGGDESANSWHSLKTSSQDPPLSTTPLPAALPMFSAGLGLIAILAWHRRRRATPFSV